MFRCQRWPKSLLFRPGILLPDELQHLPPGFLWLRPVRGFFLRGGAGALGLLLRDIAARVSSPAGSSAPTSWLRRPAAASGSSLAPAPLLVEAPSYSSLSSSTRPPLEAAG